MPKGVYQRKPKIGPEPRSAAEIEGSLAAASPVVSEKPSVKSKPKPKATATLTDGVVPSEAAALAAYDPTPIEPKVKNPKGELWRVLMAVHNGEWHPRLAAQGKATGNVPTRCDYAGVMCPAAMVEVLAHSEEEAKRKAAHMLAAVHA